jgi:hypothetical protein
MALGISMILLTEDAQLSAADIQGDLAARFPDLPASSDPAEDGNTLSFALGSADVILGKMPAPIPWSELEGPCATSVLWPNAADTVKAHKEHIIVTVSGDSLDPIQLATLLTQATASVLATTPAALGVYWGSATLVIPKNVFIDFATEVLPEGPPLHIWVDFRVGNTEDGQSSLGFTQGMEALGHMEFEALESPETFADLRERFMGLAGYVLENGPVIRDGDTIGEDANERIRVVYSDPAFGHKNKVMRLEYETPIPG